MDIHVNYTEAFGYFVNCSPNNGKIPALRYFHKDTGYPRKIFIHFDEGFGRCIYDIPFAVKKKELEKIVKLLRKADQSALRIFADMLKFEKYL